MRPSDAAAPGSRKVEPTDPKPRRRRRSPSDARRAARRGSERVARQRHDTWARPGEPLGTIVEGLTTELEQLYDEKRRQTR